MLKHLKVTKILRIFLKKFCESPVPVSHCVRARTSKTPSPRKSLYLIMRPLEPKNPNNPLKEREREVGVREGERKWGTFFPLDTKGLLRQTMSGIHVRNRSNISKRAIVGRTTKKYFSHFKVCISFIFR